MKPWYRVVVPREDLRQRRPLDARQFAVHLDEVVRGDAPDEYAIAERFFDRTFITDGLQRFSGEVLRRLAGERQGSNAVLNLVTGFGGGKTHALTLVYHLVKNGPGARSLRGVPDLLDSARLDQVPAAAVAVFVGTDWDVVEGRGGNGEAHRRTPWGEIAWQLAQQTGRPELFEAAAQQDEARIRPGKEAIRRFLPDDRPVLILMDEVMNFMTGARAQTVGQSTLASQFFEFLHNLTEEADARDRLCLVVSLPKSEGEMSAEDEADFDRLQNVTRRVALPYVLAKDLEIPEIVRRRLFESIGDPHDVRDTARAFARWLDDHRDLVPTWFPVDAAEERFRATYPFHPTVLSVFERKWQALPNFQRTRGILRLLAQWVSIAYHEGYQAGHADPLVGIGSAPLDDQFFRAAVLDQLRNEELQGAIISDIAGEQSFALRLDEAQGVSDAIRKGRIHRKVATTILFESSGGQAAERQWATLPEIRLAVGEPGLDIGNLETALGGLKENCYFLLVEHGDYRFSTKQNLNRVLSDKQAALEHHEVDEHTRAAVRRVFESRKGVARPIEVVFFPQEPKDVPNLPALHIVVLHPSQARSESRTQAFIERCMREYGVQPRSFGNALIWSVPDSAGPLLSLARRHLALERLDDEGRIDTDQLEQFHELRARASGDLHEAVWRTYRWLLFLGPDGGLQEEDLGIVHSSMAQSMQALIQLRLRQRDELTDVLAPTRIIQNWPAVGPEWNTKRVRDAVFASPRFTRPLDLQVLRTTITRGVREEHFGYALKRGSDVIRILYGDALDPAEVEFSDDIALVLPDAAKALKAAEPAPETPVPSLQPESQQPPPSPGPSGKQPPIFGEERVSAVQWAGDLPPQRWTQFYTRVLSPLVNDAGLHLKVEFEARPPNGLLQDRIDALRQSLSDLGLSTNLSVESHEETQETRDA